MLYFAFIPLFLLCFLFSAWASFRVNSTFKKYNRVPNRSGLTGYDTANRLLRRNISSSIRVGRVSGTLSDHYDPSNGVVNLSESTYGFASVGAVAVAAHEIGHVMQHEKGYWPYRIRSMLVPISNFGSRLAMPLVIIGVILTWLGMYPNPDGSLNFADYCIYGGIILYGLSTLFTLVTLPVELDASRRAKEMLLAEGILTRDEVAGAKKVLSAAALTYVAALMTSIVYFLRFFLVVLSMSGRRRR